MKDSLSVVSVLLVIFYMGWFMWKQRELIQSQNDYIDQLEHDAIIQNILLQQVIQEKESPIYKKNYIIAAKTNQSFSLIFNILLYNSTYDRRNTRKSRRN